MSGYSRKNLGVIKCPKCNYETEWEELFYGKSRDMINWEDGEEFDYICECCGHKFRLVTVVHHQFKTVKKRGKNGIFI